MMSMMPMYFFTATDLKNFLFYGLNISGVKGFVVLCVVLLVCMALFEGFKLIKIFFELKVKQDPLTYGQTDNTGDRVGLLSSLKIPTDIRQIQKIRLKYHFLSSLAHMTNLTLAYIIMLAFMSYSVWAAIALTLGSGVGYWIFGFIQQHMVSKFRNLSHLQMMNMKDKERQEEVSAAINVYDTEPCHM